MKRIIRRCEWPGDDPLYIEYHDKEWGVPEYDDRVLFEFLILEGAQAGLSWISILRRRESYRKAFRGFDPESMARFGEKEIGELLEDSGIIRNRKKIEGAAANARAYLHLRERKGSLSAFLWDFVDGQPTINRWKSPEEVPSGTPLSEKISRAMKKEGFVFFGPTICYAHMQAVGMVNDHLTYCFRHPDNLKE